MDMSLVKLRKLVMDSDFTFTFHFHALEKKMATYSSVLAWRIPGTGEPGGLPSMGSHKVGHDWSDLAVGIMSVSLGRQFQLNKDFLYFLVFQAISGYTHTYSWNGGQNSVGFYLSYKSESFLKLPQQKAYRLGHDRMTNTFTLLSYQLVLHDIMCWQKLTCYKYHE